MNSNCNKDSTLCFKCHKMGHYKNECPTWERNVNCVDEWKEDVLLMAQADQDIGEKNMGGILTRVVVTTCAETKTGSLNLTNMTSTNM